ncbi:apoptosis regulator R1-like [Takifugu rubripes]|uniref:apoptosis regulator R1-like n=1 Tax=Takifugu rubripes TaxID=31033 RepID=UPI0011451E99|nr:apoptosis regulator R1-like [Takifugu rubripes]
MSNRELVENYLIYKLSQKYPGTVSPPAGTGREALNAALRSMANKYERDFMEQAGDLSPYVAVTRNKAGFNKGSASEPVCHVADWMTDYLDQRINPWIESQGGWDCFVTIYGEDACTQQSSGRQA